VKCGGPCRRMLRWLLLGALSSAMGLGCLVRAESRDERAVRAAYVYNLIRYVEWPSKQTDLIVGVVGEPSTGDVLEQLLNGKEDGGRKIRVVSAYTQEDFGRCSLLYVTGGSEADLSRLLDRVKGRAVLTVGESDVFARGGGMVALVNTGEHIRIEINLEAAQAGGIRISSRVLSLSTIVRDTGKGGH
jgi:YfiR/HmsC-like